MRLIAFGCSLTYGHGLPDCWDPVEQQPLDKSSSFAWPEVVAKNLNLTCINTSFPGASNKEILFKIQNFNFNPDDIVVILWTFPGRSCIIQNSNDVIVNNKFDNTVFKRIIPNSNDHDSKGFYISYDDVDALVDSYTRIEYANLYFKSRGIKAFHFITEERLVANFSWFTTKLEVTYMSEIKKHLPLALDDQHPGKHAHYKFAEEVIAIINNTSVVDS
jgi:hypothetical protein